MKDLIKKIYLNFMGYNKPYSLDNQSYFKTCIKKIDMPVATISFDDQSPYYNVNRNIDYGLLNGQMDNYLDILLKKKCSITSFIIPCFFDKNFKINDFNIKEYPNWVNKLLSHNPKKFEIGIHGTFHYQKNIFFQNHCEYAFLNEDEFHNLIDKSIKIFSNLNINYSGFRQPGWDISTSIKPFFFKQLGFKYIASSSLNAGFNSKVQRVSNYHPTLCDNIVNIPQNIEIGWNNKKIEDEIEKIIKINGIISIKAHFANRKIANPLNKENQKKLLDLIEFINKKHKIKWMTFDEIAKNVN